MCCYHITLKEILCILKQLCATGPHEQPKVYCHVLSLFIFRADLAVKFKIRKIQRALNSPHMNHTSLSNSNKHCLFRKLKCLFKAACTYMRNSDQIKYPISYPALLISYLSWMKITVDLLVELCLKHSRLKLIPQVIQNMKDKISRLEKKKKKCSRLCICFSKLVTQKVV